MSKLVRFLMAISICVGSIIFSPPVVNAKSCHDVEFIFARGSGESLNDTGMTAWRDALTSELKGSSLTYNFYELGSEKQDGFSYPAVAVAGSAEGYFNLVGAVVSSGESSNFGSSVISGSRELKSYVNHISRSCPKTKFVLGGYSQGGMVVSRTLPELDANKIAYAASFGDPKLYLPEGQGIMPAACLGKDYSNYRAYVPDCRAYEGVLGSYRPYQPAGYLDKIGVWCNTKDIMCSSGVSLKDHTSYVSAGLYSQAAAKIKQRLSQEFPGKLTDDTATRNLAILIDSTGSMGSMISRYKNEAEKLAKQVFDEGGKVALYEYRDLNDPFTPVRHCDYSCSYDEFSARLRTITARGGGDAPESALSAIMVAMNSLKWQVGATKSIVLLTDAPYLSPDRDGVSLADVTRRSLEIDPVNVYIIAKSPDQKCYAELAEATGGKVFGIKDELDLSTEFMLSRPVAILSSESYHAAVDEKIVFDASKSFGLKGEELHYDWDLDGDGVFELTDAEAKLESSYPAVFSGFIQVRVRNEAGYYSTMSAQVSVVDPRAPQPALPEITSLTVDSVTSDSARLHFSTDAENLLLVINDAVAGSINAKAQSTLTITNLTSTIEVKLIPYSATAKGAAKVVTITPLAPKVPNTGSNGSANHRAHLGKVKLEQGIWRRYYEPSAN